MSDGFRRAVVTGGAGFLGSHLCERLLAEGTAVVCLDNFLTGTAENLRHLLDHPDLELVRRDVSCPLPVAGEVDLVLHFASSASPTDYSRYPIDTLSVGSVGTRRALDLAVAKGARFVLASTSEVYGDPRGGYDEAKQFAEALTMAYWRRGADTGVVRVFDTYGPRMRTDDGRAVPTFVTQALRGDPLTVAGDGSQTRSICHISDTVAGVLAMARSDEPGPVDIGNPEEMTVLELAERIVRLVGSGSAITFGPRPVDDPTTRQPDITAARRLLGWAPRVGWEDGLSSTIDWFAAHLFENPVTIGS
jgi:dTDP-glucose 4,6-dehydratase